MKQYTLDTQALRSKVFINTESNTGIVEYTSVDSSLDSYQINLGDPILGTDGITITTVVPPGVGMIRAVVLTPSTVTKTYVNSETSASSYATVMWPLDGDASVKRNSQVVRVMTSESPNVSVTIKNSSPSVAVSQAILYYSIDDMDLFEAWISGDSSTESMTGSGLLGSFSFDKSDTKLVYTVPKGKEGIIDLYICNKGPSSIIDVYVSGNSTPTSADAIRFKIVLPFKQRDASNTEFDQYTLTVRAIVATAGTNIWVKVAGKGSSSTSSSASSTTSNTSTSSTSNVSLLPTWVSTQTASSTATTQYQSATTASTTSTTSTTTKESLSVSVRVSGYIKKKEV